MDESMASVTVYQPHKSNGVDGSMLGGSILSASGGVLELDRPLHHSSALHHHQALPHHLQGLAPLSSTQHLNACHDSDQSLKLECKGNLKAGLLCSKGKSGGTSDEDEPSFTEEGDYQHGGRGKKSSPWQRVKWTDAMIQLLIKVVLLVGEDGTVESSEGNKRKPGLLQKKGKWKSVSSVMNESGCYVSPQQCEDKFNDLNKRYKRLNDILGRETALKVVESPSLLDNLENLPPKVKEDIKKLLSSKHLFYKEMCSYHSGCKSLVSADFEFRPSTQAEMSAKGKEYLDFARPERLDNDVDEGEEDDAEDEDEDDDYDDHDEENGAENVCNLPSPFGKKRKLSSYTDGFHGSSCDYARDIGLGSLNIDFTSMMQSGLTVEHCQLLRTRVMQLEEQKVSLQAQALELEKRRFKWQKFNVKKDQELGRLREDNKKMKIENERLALELKQKELDIECKRSAASMTSLDVILDRLQTKEHLDSTDRGSGY